MQIPHKPRAHLRTIASRGSARTMPGMPIRPELKAELFSLPAVERRELADQLYDSLDGTPDPEWEQAWTSELEQRLVEAQEARVELVDADQVHAELQAELHPPSR